MSKRPPSRPGRRPGAGRTRLRPRGVPRSPARSSFRSCAGPGPGPGSRRRCAGEGGLAAAAMHEAADDKIPGHRPRGGRREQPASKRAVPGGRRVPVLAAAAACPRGRHPHPHQQAGQPRVGRGVRLPVAVLFLARRRAPADQRVRAAGPGPVAGAEAGLRADGLARLIGPNRARVLRLLGEPRSTTQLAALTGLPLGAVSNHLRVLLEAGAVLRRRTGREVLYWRTSLGDVLAASGQN